MIRELFRSKFFRHASILQGGGFVQFGISFAGSVFIARLLGPDQYGVYALAAALMGTIGLFLDWGQGSGALILFSKAFANNDREEMERVGAFNMKMTLLLYACIGIPAFFAADYLGMALYHRPDLGLYVRLLLVSSLVVAGFGFFALVLQVTRRVFSLTVLENIDQALKTGGMLIGLFLGFGIAGVAGGQMGGAAVSFCVALWAYRKYVQPLGIVPRIRAMLSKMRGLSYAAYLRFSFPIALDKNITELYHIGIMLILGRMASPAEAGYFRISLSYISLSLFVLGSVSRLLQDQFPKDQVRDPKVLRSHFLKVSVISGFVSMAIGTVLVIMGPFLLRLVYGPEYEGAIPLIRAFWWFSAVMGFGVGLGSLYRTLNKMQFTIKMHLVILAIGMPVTLYLTSVLGAAGAVYGITLMKGSATVYALFFGIHLLNRIQTSNHVP